MNIIYFNRVINKYNKYYIINDCEHIGKHHKFQPFEIKFSGDICARASRYIFFFGRINDNNFYASTTLNNYLVFSRFQHG